MGDLNRRIHARFSKRAMSHNCVVGDVARVEGVLVEFPETLHAGVSAVGSTPIQGASLYGHVEIVSCLLAAKADINDRGVSGATPLFCTMLRGQTELAGELLKA